MKGKTNRLASYSKKAKKLEVKLLYSKELVPTWSLKNIMIRNIEEFNFLTNQFRIYKELEFDEPDPYPNAVVPH